MRDSCWMRGPALTFVQYSFKSIGQLTNGPSTGDLAGHRRKISGCVPEALLARWGPSIRERTKSSRREGESEHGHCKTGYDLFPPRDLRRASLRHLSLPAWAIEPAHCCDRPTIRPFGDADPHMRRRNS